MRIFFSVGEPSGDLHGANLIRDLRAISPTVECAGYGGPKMAAAGCDLHADLTQLAVMWIVRVLLKLHVFIQLLRDADRYFAIRRPDAVVLIDYPGFNWWIARIAKKHGVPVFYYGAPQIWAWLQYRVRKMRRLVDHVLCKLPFEAKWFSERGCSATFVGHPYFDEMERRRPDEEFLAAMAERPGPLVTLLPGSRRQEVRSNMAAFLKAADRIRREVPGVRFAVAAFNEEQAAIAQELVSQTSVSAEVHAGRTSELIAAARCCLACSGSVSLELLWHEKPAAVHYRVGPLWYFLCRYYFTRVRFITLVNLLADDPFDLSRGGYDDDAPGAENIPFPEFPTWIDVSHRLAKHAVRWLTDDIEHHRRTLLLRGLKRQVAQGGASHTAARYILRALAGQQRAAA